MNMYEGTFPAVLPLRPCPLSDRGIRPHVCGGGTFIHVHSLSPRSQHPHNERTNKMNKDRIQGSVEQAKGKVKEVAGKVTGDSKLESEGKVQVGTGKIQNAVGGFKDTVKEAVKQ